MTDSTTSKATRSATVSTGGTSSPSSTLVVGFDRADRAMFPAATVAQAQVHIDVEEASPAPADSVQSHDYEWFDLSGKGLPIQPASGGSTSLPVPATGEVDLQKRIDAVLKNVRLRAENTPLQSNPLLSRSGRSAQVYLQDLVQALQAEALQTRRGALHNLICHW